MLQKKNPTVPTAVSPFIKLADGFRLAEWFSEHVNVLR